MIRVQIPVKLRVRKCRIPGCQCGRWLVTRNGTLWSIQPTWFEAMQVITEARS